MASRFNSQQFHLDQLVATFEALEISIMWRGEDGTVEEQLVSDIMLTQKEMDDKIIVFNAIVDSWFNTSLLETISKDGLTNASRIDIKKAESTYKLLKMNVQKLLMSTEGMKGYEFYLDKIMDMQEKVMGFKSVINV